MSSRAKKTKSSAKQSVVFKRPTGPVPSARVLARHEGELMERASRGFSDGEVKEAGISPVHAKAWRLPLDIRRRSVLGENVESLKAWHSKAEKLTVSKEVKMVEAEVEKVVKEVRKGASKAKKEVTKIEKEVVEKVEKPKGRRPKKAKAEED
jgi:ribosomal protein L13E